ncbi:DUF5819 family protein [Streptomyces sp. 7-21]|jgi:hypothetical protein|uniref:DUF5819 family protein n=1 Tax=Streptomyces sp. 7-21 TaxID=2802283 RepID=UPI00191F1130|nr:DUF5819 family protein [Streptomyces sp. 7-21]MBL1066077.1 hypothetical protein [Streptomyces sp. 7-21]
MPHQTPQPDETRAAAAGAGEDAPSLPAANPASQARLGALSLPARLVIAGAVGVLAVYTAWHLLMVFLFVAPDNTLSEDHEETMNDYIYPEFEQSWQLFAPNPLQRNVTVEVRAEIREDGGVSTTDWISLTAMDIENIEHHPFPSHTAQNELRRAWDFYVDSHDEEGEPRGERGELSEEYLTRIALLRLDQRSQVDVEDVSRIQLRSVTRLVPAPEWSKEESEAERSTYELDWWVVTTEHLPDGVRAGSGAAAGGESR